MFPTASMGKYLLKVKNKDIGTSCLVLLSMTLGKSLSSGYWLKLLPWSASRQTSSSDRMTDKTSLLSATIHVVSNFLLDSESCRDGQMPTKVFIKTLYSFSFFWKQLYPLRRKLIISDNTESPQEHLRIPTTNSINRKIATNLSVT